MIRGLIKHILHECPYFLLPNELSENCRPDTPLLQALGGGSAGTKGKIG